MANLRLVRFSILLSLLMATDAVAGDCRAELRPLLLAQPPDRTALLELQSFCQAEADAGDVDSLYQAALFHLGLVDFDVDRALPMIETAATQGVSEAQYWLAWQYEAGPLLPDNLQLALEWYQRAADNEHRLALNRLATAYLSGELGVAADPRKAAGFRARAERCSNSSS